jgi:hypothetical protein
MEAVFLTRTRRSDRERKTVMNANSARKLFAAALAAYFLWVGALAIMAVVSGSRPTAGTIRPAVNLTPPAPDSEKPND